MTEFIQDCMRHQYDSLYTTVCHQYDSLYTTVCHQYDSLYTTVCHQYDQLLIRPYASAVGSIAQLVKLSQ
jgi:hypothetical protein